MPAFPHASSFVSGLSDEVFGDLRARARGRRFHPLHIGDTYLQAPAAVRAADLSGAGLRYSPVPGEPGLLDAIVARWEERSGITLDRDCIQVMSGATAALGVIAQTLLEPGDEVLLPSPFWPLIRGIVASRGAKAVQIPLWAQLQDADFDPQAMLESATTPRTVAIYLNSPHNPTGQLLSAELLDVIADHAERHDLWVICDEAYEDLWYGAAPPPPVWMHPRLRPRAIVTHTFSKGYAMAGARIAYTHGPAPILAALRGVQTFVTYCAAKPMQLAAARALQEGASWQAEARQLYREAGAKVAEVFGVAQPAAGTFLFADLSQRLGDADLMSFLGRCLEAGVLLTPGHACGDGFGRSVRVCFTAVPPADLEDALAKIRGVLG